MINVVIKAIAKPFYQAHAGFFFFLFFIVGGFIRSDEHITIAKYVAQSDFLTVILIFIFCLYHLKAWLFTRSLLRNNAFLFLRDMYLIDRKKQAAVVVAVHLSISIVILVYGLFVLGVMVMEKSYHRALLISSYFLVSVAVYTMAVLKQMKRPVKEVKINVFVSYLNRQIYRPFALWYPIYLLKNRPILLFLSKLVSISILVACFSTYNTLFYDWRFLGISVVAAMSVNIVIVHSLFYFYIRQLPILKNLPLSSVKRVVYFFATSCLLLMPEIIVVMRRLPVEAPNFYAWQVMFYAIGNFLFYLHWIILKNADIERLGKFSFFSTIVQIYLVLFGLPLYGLVIIMIPVIIVAQKRYLVMHDY